VPEPMVDMSDAVEGLQQGSLCGCAAVLTMVDAKHALQHLNEAKPEGVVNEAVQQVAFADRILLNKIDLVTPAEKAAVASAIRVRAKGHASLAPG